MWCDEFSWKRTHDINIQLAGDEDFSQILCGEFCRRSQFFFDLWRERAAPDFDYAPTDEPPAPGHAFTTLMDTLLPTQYAHKKGAEILAMRPRRRGGWLGAMHTGTFARILFFWQRSNGLTRLYSRGAHIQANCYHIQSHASRHKAAYSGAFHCRLEYGCFFSS